MYSNIYNPQASLDRINNQIAELERMKSQLPPVQQPITQNFQLAPTSDFIKYDNSIEEVSKNMVIGDTPYFSKDMSVVWIKNTKNEIKTYELNEIIPKDEKDLTIEYLQSQIEELKGKLNNESNVTNDASKHDKTNTSKDDESNGATTKKN